MLSGLPEPYILYYFFDFSAIWQAQDFVIFAENCCISSIRYTIAFYT
ncbi:hypothetical protein RVIR1_14010 [Candidatus Rickettsiella viridis]|uniref:Uncharacterized protein n=1 Tax=Candidatus Rickettsiella viridis TaxID=676208 RepID=A0A2Z5UW47_9COXI|nr:hypothetical protein RVIR1_14010 [Candidatus Rickettsiella viridis]